MAPINTMHDFIVKLRSTCFDANIFQKRFPNFWVSGVKHTDLAPSAHLEPWSQSSPAIPPTQTPTHHPSKEASSI
jgi:hypothetical protein